MHTVSSVGRRASLSVALAIILTATAGPSVAQEALHVASDGKVGIGTDAPSADLEIRSDVVSPTLSMLLVNNVSGPPRIEQRNGAGNHTWRQTVTAQGVYAVDDILDGVFELTLAQNGDLTITGNVITTNCPSGCGPDYVFDESYDLMPLEELEGFVSEHRHLPNIPSAREMEEQGIDMTRLQLRMLEKIEELVLYALDQQRTIARQRQMLLSHEERFEALIERLEGRLGPLEGRSTEDLDQTSP